MHPSEFPGACAAGHVDVVKRAVGSDPSLVAAGDDAGYTGLHHAAEKGHFAIARLLIEAGAPLEATEAKHKATPLICAVYYGQAEIVRLLLEAGADASYTDVKGKRALEYAEGALEPANAKWLEAPVEQYRSVAELLRGAEGQAL